MPALRTFTFRSVFGCDFGHPGGPDAVTTDTQPGFYWAGEVAAAGDDLAKRLSLSLLRLPLPAAFEQSLLACRAAIRALRKAKQDESLWLARLYCIAALHSMLEGPSEYREELTSLLIAEYKARYQIPPEVWGTLPIDYDGLGFRDFQRLKTTDLKWIIAAWGQPQSHSTLRKQHPEVWKAAVVALVRSEYERDARNPYYGGRLTPEEWRSRRLDAKRLFDEMSAASRPTT